MKVILYLITFSSVFQSSLFFKFCNTHHNISCLQWKATSSFLPSQLFFSPFKQKALKAIAALPLSEKQE